eukprot:TRINITY_DN10054_c0_g1_i3.p3 TRINITY_DN10054_c0_g1~~TRINITY_DN10054_c0_g1_i3.p3  ORF type:complete len:123 (+),score=8.91 TRINITY_DN10054_c0_g1_i3:293-661(+)
MRFNVDGRERSRLLRRAEIGGAASARVVHDAPGVVELLVAASGEFYSTALQMVAGGNAAEVISAEGCDGHVAAGRLPPSPSRASASPRASEHHASRIASDGPSACSGSAGPSSATMTTTCGL